MVYTKAKRGVVALWFKCPRCESGKVVEVNRIVTTIQLLGFSFALFVSGLLFTSFLHTLLWICAAIVLIAGIITPFMGKTIKCKDCENTWDRPC